jgi:copper chaperone CopZ
MPHSTLSDLDKKMSSSLSSDERVRPSSSCVDDCSCSAAVATARPANEAAASTSAAPAESVKGHATLKLQVEGLCCTECTVVVERVLARRSGVQHLPYSIRSREVQVDFDPSRVSPKELAGSPVLAAATEVVPDVFVAFSSVRLLNASHKPK